ALANLEPAPPELNRDRLMFAAGAESRRPVIRLWQATAGFMVAVGYAAGVYFPLSPPAPVVREVPVERPVAVPMAVEPAPTPTTPVAVPTPEPPAPTSPDPSGQAVIHYFFQPDDSGP